MDFDDLDAIEAASWEARWALRQAVGEAGPRRAARCVGEGAGSAPPAEAPEGGAEAPAFAPPRRRLASAEAPGARIDVVARHALLGTELRLALPESAKFKHIKRALAAFLDVQEGSGRLQVIHKVDGIYKPYKDDARLGAIRDVLIACPGLDTFGGDGAADVSLSEAEMTASEDEHPGDHARNARNVGDSAVAADGRADVRDGRGAGDEDVEDVDDGRVPSSSSSQARASWLTARIGLRPGGVGDGRGSTRLAAKGPCMTRRQAMNLQSDLLEGFAEPAFRAELNDLVARRASFATQAEFVRSRQELMLKVQSRVLPEYGFPGTLSGVVQMMGALGPFVRDPEVQTLGAEINALIGLDMPEDTWRDVSRQCRDLRTDAATRAAGLREMRQRREEVARERLVREERLAKGKGVSSLPARVPIPKAWLEDASDEDLPATSFPPFHGLAGAPSTGIVEFLQALPFPKWPSPFSPLVLCVTGSWTDEQPRPMQWMAGLYISPVIVGRSGRERFQLLLGGQRSSVIYPSVDDANHVDEYTVCGPDSDSEGRSWQIGKGYPKAEDGAQPGSRFAIVAALDHGATVKLVGWQQY